jgi:hypothetical protein
MKTFPALCLMLFAVSIASGFQTSDWVKFNSPAGNFSILLPKQPTEEKKTTATPYPSHTATMYLANVTGQLYLVGWVDYEPSFVFNTVKELEANRDNMVKALNGKLLTSNRIVFGTYQGLDFTGEFLSRDRQFLFKAKVFIVGKRPYILTYVFPQGEESIPNRNRFFSSFQIARKV